MRTLALRALAAGAALLLAYPAFAQAPPGGGRGGFGGGGFDPILNKSVQDELKLTDGQKADLQKIQEKQTAARQKARESGDQEKGREIMLAAREETKKELDKWKEASLKPDQAKRLKQIQLQVSGIRAFADADVQKDLNLSDKQKEEVKQIAEEVQKDARELFQNRGPDTMQKVQALNKEAMGKASALLTDDQKKSWQAMMGEKFEMKMEPGQGGRQGRQSKSKDSPKSE